MSKFEQVEELTRLVKNTVKRPLTPTEKAGYNSIFMLCEMGKELEARIAELEARIAELEAENADLKKHSEWLEGNLDLKNTVIADLKNQLRDALERKNKRWLKAEARAMYSGVHIKKRGQSHTPL